MRQRLNCKRTLEVALLIKTDSEWHRGVIQGVASCRTSEEEWVFTVPPADSAGEVKLPKDWQGDGIIFRASSPELVQKVREREVPTVNISWLGNGSQFPRVVSDEAACAELVGAYFLEKQLDNFGYIGHPPWQDYGNTIETTLRGIAETNGGNLSCCPTSYSAKESMGVDREQLRRWIEKLDKPCAIVVWSSFAGYLVVLTCNQLGLEIPRTVSIVCIEHDPMWSVLAPIPLSNVDQDPNRVGFKAGHLLRSMILGERQTEKPPILVPPFEIVERLSSKISAVSDPMLRKAIEFIQQNATAGVNVLDVAKHLGISRRSLEEKFKKVLACPPALFIRRQQLREVCRLLRGTDLNVDTIAKRTGFSYPEVLMRVFRREYKITPTKYRRQCQSRGS